MPMPKRVEFPAAIEPLVQFIEDTPPAEILDAHAGEAARRHADPGPC